MIHIKYTNEAVEFFKKAGLVMDGEPNLDRAFLRNTHTGEILELVVEGGLGVYCRVDKERKSCGAHGPVATPDAPKHTETLGTVGTDDSCGFDNLAASITESCLAPLRKKMEHILAAWIKTAATFARDTDFYKRLLSECAGLLGPEAFMSDDGAIHDTPMYSLIPELLKHRLNADKFSNYPEAPFEAVPL